MSATDPATQLVGVKVCGALSGLVFVNSLSSSVMEMRQQVARLLGADTAGVRMIAKGVAMQVTDHVTRVSP